MIPDNRDRIEELLKPFGWVLKPLGCFVFCLAGWLISSLLSDESIGMAYVWAGIGLILFSAQLERSWLNRLAFPPLTTLVFTLNLRWISGGFILLLSDNQAPHEVFGWIVCFFGLVYCYDTLLAPKVEASPIGRLMEK